MSSFKHEQRDSYTLWQRIRGFFGVKCKSHLRPENGSGYYADCNLSLGHKKRHTNGVVRWGYGDNWLESENW